jgi:Ni,Fe-hydrogenase III large subunit
MPDPKLPGIYNGARIGLSDIPLLAPVEFRETVLNKVGSGSRIVALFGAPVQKEGIRLFIALTQNGSGRLQLACTDVTGVYPSLTPECPQAHLFEREIAEQWGLVPQGHPWLKPVRFPYAPVSTTDFFSVHGQEIHEVAVGPVHAGVIEPGHFRFQCHGESVLHLEISLGYQHRGIERALTGGPDKRTIYYMETAAGDTTIGHTLAYSQIVEALAGINIPVRAQAIEGIALELERLANHTGDLGALAGDIGYLPTASYCGRIRGDFLNMTAMICGNRFGRGIVRSGGVRFDIDDALGSQLLERLEQAARDVQEAVNLLFNTPSVLSRFEGIGKIESKVCRELGLVGPVARACGVEQDVRFDFPTGIFRFAQIPVSIWQNGDVFARAYLRWLEIQRSINFVRDRLKSLSAGAIKIELQELVPESLTISLVEGWRGEICHAAITDNAGRFLVYKIIDPSFHNWIGLAMALRGQAISDFPVCNKSFNLSYCGHDL